jgi:hypothetical protein
MIRSSRRSQIEIICLMAISVAISVFLGTDLFLAAANLDAFANGALQVTHDFYGIPVNATSSLMWGLGAGRWVWIAVLFIGVLIQNVLLWLIARAVVHAV